MTKIIAIIIPVIIITFLVLVSLRPSEFRIVRSARFTAPPSAIFPHINDFHLWEAWSPWAKLDPNATNTYSGAASGVGAGYAWSGNNKVGAGRMVITESRPFDLIRLKLEFLRPMKATNVTEFTFQPEGAQTVVHWSMSGHCNFGAKAFGMFVNCDNMVGRDFEKGLANLKSIVEKQTVAA